MLFDEYGQKFSLYACRRTFITFQLMTGRVTPYDMAIQCGTSTAMIEKHYSHLRSFWIADRMG